MEWYDQARVRQYGFFSGSRRLNSVKNVKKTQEMFTDPLFSVSMGGVGLEVVSALEEARETGRAYTVSR